MPIEVPDHIFDEVTYEVDEINVRGLLMQPHKSVKRIVIYLRGGKGRVGIVRAGRIIQLLDVISFVFRTNYRGNNGSEGKDEFYDRYLNDVTVAVLILNAMYPYAYIHMIGFSRGGLQGLLTFQDLPVTSFIIWGCVSD